MLSINRLLGREGQGRWGIGLHAAVASSIFRLPERDRSLVTQLSSDSGDCVSALADLLASGVAQTRRKQPVRPGVVISNRYCRYLAIPWSDALLSQDGGRAYLLRAFSEVYGDAARAWEIVCQDARYGHQRLACAVDASLLSGVRSSCSLNKVMPAFIRPYFDVALDRFRHQIKAGRGAIAVVEDEVMTIACWVGGAIVEVDIEPCEDGWQEVLAAWCARNELIDAALMEVLVVCPPGWVGHAENEAMQPGWRLLDWPEELKASLAENPALALAACAL